MFQTAVCTQCYNILENYTIGQCPECRTVRPERGWILLPYTVAGHYRLLSQVSRDEVSSVFAGLELDEARAVLIRLGKKVSGGGSSQIMTLFQREKEISEVAHKENLDICTQVYELDNTGGLSISIQGYHGLKSLRSLLRSRGSFEPDYACNIGSYIAGVVYRIHEKGLIHGNLTLDHIMLNPKDPTGSMAGLVGLEHACYNGDCPSILPPESPYIAPEARIPGGLTPASDCYSIAAIIWELVTGKPISEQSIEHKPDIMPTVLFVELRRMLRKDVRTRVSDAGEMADSMRSVSGLIWEFEAVSSECGNVVKQMVEIDNKVHNETWFRKALKKEGYTIARLDRLKQDLNRICEQVGELNGDPKIFRDRMNRVGKHIRNINDIILNEKGRVVHSSNKWIVAGVAGVVLLALAGVFLVRPYWKGHQREKNFGALQQLCMSLKGHISTTENMLNEHKIPECAPGTRQNTFATEGQIVSPLTSVRINVFKVCGDVKQGKGRPDVLKNRLDDLIPKVKRLTHACVLKKTVKKKP